jgi:hypothetical protein
MHGEKCEYDKEQKFDGGMNWKPLRFDLTGKSQGSETPPYCRELEVKGPKG